MTIGENIKGFRKLKKITQQELGKRIGKKEITVRKYEKGDILPPIDVLLKISDALEIPYLDLIENTEYDNLKDKEKMQISVHAFPSPGHYIGDRVHDPIKEFNLVNDECSEEEKKMIYELLQHYNWGYCDNRYDLSKIDDEQYKDLKIMFYNTMKVILKDCKK